MRTILDLYRPYTHALGTLAVIAGLLALFVVAMGAI